MQVKYNTPQGSLTKVQENKRPKCSNKSHALALKRRAKLVLVKGGLQDTLRQLYGGEE